MTQMKKVDKGNCREKKSFWRMFVCFSQVNEMKMKKVERIMLNQFIYLTLKCREKRT